MSFEQTLEKVVDSKISKALEGGSKTVLAEYRGADSQGKEWVVLAGSNETTPLSRSTVEASPGDTVQVTIGNGKAVMDANISNPSAGVKGVKTATEKADRAISYATQAKTAADNAQISANNAAQAAGDAQTSANSAATAASEAWNHADEAATAAATAWGHADDAATAAATAQTAAETADGKAVAAGQAAATANGYALGALAGLSTLESVIDTVNWFADHKTASTDTSVDSGKTYYIYDSSTGALSAVTPEGTENPSEEGWYELDETIQNYVVSHVAETEAGLYVLSLSNGWRVLISSGATQQYEAGVYIIDGNGVVQQSTNADGIDFNANRQWHVGSNDAYILYTPASGNTPASITIGGSNINLGDSRTLADLMGQVDSTLIFKVTEGYSDDNENVTLSAHVYRGGVDIVSEYDDDDFAWYMKNESGTAQNHRIPLVPLPEPNTNGKTVTIARSTVGYGAAIVCHFTEPQNAVLLDENDDTLTDSDDTPLAARTPSGDYVRVADLEVETTVFDTDKLMVVGSEDEHLVTVETLKGVFGTPSYTNITDKPSIENVTLIGNKTFPDLGIFRTDSQGYSVADDYTLTTMDINDLWANAVAIG